MKRKINKISPYIGTIIFLTLSIIIICTGLMKRSKASEHNNAKKQAADQSSSNLITFLSDINHDGKKEKLVVDLGNVKDQETATLSVINESGKTIWSGEAGLPHAGWNSFYLSTIDGEDYLLRYQPEIYQGYADYSFDIFYLDQNGAEHSIDSDNIKFSINPGNVNYDPQELISFADEVNYYLKKSFLLLSTEEGQLAYSTKNNKITRLETYSWLGHGKKEYDRQAILDQLIKYKEDNASIPR